MKKQKKALWAKVASCGLVLALVTSMMPVAALATDSEDLSIEGQEQIQDGTIASADDEAESSTAEEAVDAEGADETVGLDDVSENAVTPEGTEDSPTIGYTTEASGQTAADVPLSAAGEEVAPVAGTIEYGGLAYTIDPENPDVAMVTGLASDKPVGSVAVQSRIASDGKFYEVASIGTSAHGQREGSVYKDELFDLAAVAEGVTEISIPASIAHIDLAFFQLFPNACSVQVDSNNGSYASAGGMLFDKGLTHLLMVPSGFVGEAQIPSEVADIPAYAFARCTSLSAISCADGNVSFSTMNGVLYSADGSVLLAAPSGLGSTVAIADACAYIAEGAFAGNAALDTIVVQGCVQQIDAAAFPSAVPETAVVVLDVEAGEQEDAKAAWVAAGFRDFVESSSAQDTIEPSEGSGFAFEMLDDRTLEVRWQGDDPAPADLQIPSFGIADGIRYRVSGIAPDGFKGQTDIRRVEIPAGVGQIGANAFEGVTGLVEVEIPASVTSIGERAFAGCEALTALQLNEGVAVVGNEAFSGIGQTVLVLPASVRSIGERAFAESQSLRTVVALGAVAEVGAGVLSGVSGVDVYVPYDATGLYGWSVGAPAAGNHLYPYGLEMPTEPIDIEVGEQVDLFESGYIKAEGAVRVGYAYKAKPISISDAGVVEAKAPGTSNVEASLTLELPAQGISVIDEEVRLQQATWDSENFQPNTITLASGSASVKARASETRANNNDLVLDFGNEPITYTFAHRGEENVTTTGTLTLSDVDWYSIVDDETSGKLLTVKTSSNEYTISSQKNEKQITWVERTPKNAYCVPCGLYVEGTEVGNGSYSLANGDSSYQTGPQELMAACVSDNKDVSIHNTSSSSLEYDWKYKGSVQRTETVPTNGRQSLGELLRLSVSNWESDMGGQLYAYQSTAANYECSFGGTATSNSSICGWALSDWSTTWREGSYAQMLDSGNYVAYSEVCLYPVPLKSNAELRIDGHSAYITCNADDGSYTTDRSLTFRLNSGPVVVDGSTLRFRGAYVYNSSAGPVRNWTFDTEKYENSHSARIIGWSQTDSGYDSLLSPGTYYASDDGFTLYPQTANQLMFDAAGNDGSGGQSAAVWVTYGQPLPSISTIRPTNIKDDCEFAGWYDAKKGGTQYYTASCQPALSQWDKPNALNGVTLYPQWKNYRYTYHVNYYTMNLSGEYYSRCDKTESVTVPKGTEVSLADLESPKEGFSFDQDKISFSSVIIDANGIELDVFYKRNTYVLSFHLTNDCPCGEHSSDPEPLYLFYDQAIERNDFPSPGCDYAQATQWSGDADLFEHGDVANGNLIMPARNATLTSTWVYTTYEISFDPNGGTGGTGTIDGDVHYGPMPPLKDFSAPIRPGYTFDGWFDSDGNKLYDRNGASVGSWTSYMTIQGTLYAHWKLNYYRVDEWHKNGGIGETPAVSYVYSVEDRSESDEPRIEREGYELLGWSLTNEPDKIDFTGKLCLTDEFMARIDHEAAFSYESEHSITYVIDVYAQWRSLVPISYTVSFDSNGGTGSMADMDISPNEDVRIPATSIPFLRSHYDFAGFAMQPDGEARFVPSGADGGVTICISEADTSDGRVVLYAVWEAQLTVTAPLSVDLNLTIDASSGTVVSSESDVAGSFESQCPKDVVLSAVRSTMVKSPAVQTVFKDGWQGVQLTFGTAGSDHDRLDLDGGNYEAGSEKKHVIPKLGTLDFQVGLHLPDGLRLGVLQDGNKVQLANLVYEYALAD